MSPLHPPMLRELDFGEDLEAAQRGDEKAFARLVWRAEDAARRVLRKRGFRADGVEDEDDLLQETALRARLALRTVKARDAMRFRAWYKGIAYNLLRERRRRSSRHPMAAIRELGLLEGRAATGPDDRSSKPTKLLSALHRLPHEERAVIVMRTFLSMPWKESALVLGRPSVVAARQLYYRAKQRLREKLSAGP